MRPLTRRELGRGLLAAGVLLSPGLARAQSWRKLRFDVLRHGSPIGTHEISFLEDATTIRARICAKMRVGLGPITLFRYEHDAEEVWANGAFVSLHTKTCNNGKDLTVSAARVKDGMRIRTAAGNVIVAPPDTLPLTHWNQACMHARLFNPQDGTLLPERARAEGPDQVAFGDGRTVKAMRYAVNGIAPIEDWYGTDTSWAKLRAVAKDGSVIEYVRAV